MVFNAFDEIVVRPLCPVRVEFATVVQVVHVQFTDRVDEDVHLDLQLVDEHHHAQHHASEVGQRAKR